MPSLQTPPSQQAMSGSVDAFLNATSPNTPTPKASQQQTRQAYATPTQISHHDKCMTKDMTNQRQNTYPHNAGYGHSGGMLGPQSQFMRAGPHMPSSASSHGADASTTALAQGFGSMNLRAASYGSSMTSTTQASTMSSDYNHPHMMPMGSNQPYYVHGQVYSNGHMAPPHTGGIQHQGMYSQANAFLGSQASFQSQPYSQHGHNNSPLTAHWTPRVPSGEMPTLITPRRDSNSSNEPENAPGTPFTGYSGYHGGVAVIDRSPSALYGHSGTPSPSQLTPGYGMPAAFGKPATPQSTGLSVQMQLLLSQDPPIPRAIPAPSSPIKPLDRSLENKHGETNVYIRGLMPETTDDMLHSWGARFGDIQSSKAIIDLKTNLCKGFGFVKFHNFQDAEHCIRGFHHLGYEVSFARESFYAKLKKFADEGNTNLYVSNIPRNMNEHDLSCIFAPHKVMSARILRDSNGNGRGVGFARFETRDVCEDVIKMYNNKTITKGDDEYTIQIRYSDTHEQKALKQQTAAARQYRAAEFEYGVMQARGVIPPGVASAASLGLLTPVDQRSIISVSGSDVANEFENHLLNETG